MTKEARKIREQMIGYADALIERQDKYDVLKTVESYQFETKSRKVMRDMVTHFQESIDKTHAEITQTNKEVVNVKE